MCGRSTLSYHKSLENGKKRLKQQFSNTGQQVVKGCNRQKMGNQCGEPTVINPALCQEAIYKLWAQGQGLDQPQGIQRCGGRDHLGAGIQVIQTGGGKCQKR